MSKWAKSLRSVKSEKSVNCEKSLKGVNSGAAVSAVYVAVLSQFLMVFLIWCWQGEGEGVQVEKYMQDK